MAVNYPDSLGRLSMVLVQRNLKTSCKSKTLQNHVKQNGELLTILHIIFCGYTFRMSTLLFRWESWTRQDRQFGSSQIGWCNEWVLVYFNVEGLSVRCTTVQYTVALLWMRGFRRSILSPPGTISWWRRNLIYESIDMIGWLHVHRMLIKQYMNFNSDYWRFQQ